MKKTQRHSAVDDKRLSKKYRTNVNSLINAWKKGKADVEIASFTGVDLFTLRQIKSEIELAHRRERLENKRQALTMGQSNKQHHTFLRPLT
ncbi:MAG: hypothetical protein FH758_14650 [Firmicutes bacterium]|nr:hypothetical protein [Bacillota bacterium]